MTADVPVNETTALHAQMATTNEANQRYFAARGEFVRKFALPGVGWLYALPARARWRRAYAAAMAANEALRQEYEIYRLCRSIEEVAALLTGEPRATSPAQVEALGRFMGSVTGYNLPEVQHVIIDYTNHRGERRERAIVPWSIKFKETPHHKPAQWVLNAWDVEKCAQRTFALKDIHSWRSVEKSA
jgi:hypothetical protein